METQINFAIISRDGDILYRTADGKEYVVKYEDIPDGHPKSPTCGHLKIPHLAIDKLSKS